MRAENRLLHAHLIVAEERDSIALEALRWRQLECCADSQTAY